MVATADDIAAARYKYHDGGVGGQGPRRVDVELQAVFATDEDAVDDVELGATVVEVGGRVGAVQCGVPRLFGDGSGQSQRIYRSFRVWNIEE
jgi:hypothetical protein